MIDEEFIRNRLTELRQNKGISEYKMSLDLGHSKGYIQGISSGRALPSLSEFLYICDYLGISPADFFDEETACPEQINRITEKMRSLSETDLNIIDTLVDRLSDANTRK